MISAALSLIVKATVVTAFAIVAGWLARRRRAAVRHLIFVAAFAVLALIPAATAVLPAVPVPVRLLAMPAIGDPAHATPLNRTVEALETLDTMSALTRMMDLLDDLIHPDGYNVGLNLGRCPCLLSRPRRAGALADSSHTPSWSAMA
jgi:hypothetical protein